jgi:hypothetical protein
VGHRSRSHLRGDLHEPDWGEKHPATYYKRWGFNPTDKPPEKEAELFVKDFDAYVQNKVVAMVGGTQGVLTSTGRYLGEKRWGRRSWPPRAVAGWSQPVSRERDLPPWRAATGARLGWTSVGLS